MSFYFVLFCFFNIIIDLFTVYDAILAGGQTRLNLQYFYFLTSTNLTGSKILWDDTITHRGVFKSSYFAPSDLTVTKYLPCEQSPSIFLDKSGRGRNLCRHPRQFIMSMLQIQIFWRRQSGRYRSIHCVCQQM